MGVAQITEIFPFANKMKQMNIITEPDGINGLDMQLPIPLYALMFGVEVELEEEGLAGASDPAVAVPVQVGVAPEGLPVVGLNQAQSGPLVVTPRVEVTVFYPVTRRLVD